MISFEELAIDKEGANLIAPYFAVLLSDGKCWKCGQTTPMAAIWVPSYTEIDHEEDEHEAFADAALLHYVSALTAPVGQQVARLAPWLRYARTETYGATYLANHCEQCGALQGDWFVFGVDGPFFPQRPAEIEKIRFIPGVGAFHGCASPSVSGWMSSIEI